MNRRDYSAPRARRHLSLLPMAAVALIVAAACSSGGGDVATGQRPSVTRPQSVEPLSTAKVLAVPGLDEPLVSTKPTTDAEDAAARRALASFAAFVPHQDTLHDDTVAGMASLEELVAAYPHSGWSASAYTDLGLAYYRAGYFSRAVAAFGSAWREGKNATDWKAQAVVDRALGHVAKMHARVGHAADAEALLAEASRRSVSASATETLTAAREGAWIERNRPEVAFLCGPKALKNVLRTLGAPQSALDVADAARSGAHGFTLAQVGELAAKAGLSYRLIYRAPGQPVPVPSVVNWKVNHYAAITGRENARFQVADPTFDSGSAFLLTSQAIDEESSGFFLVPASVEQDPAWRDATPEEAQAVYGMGSTTMSTPGQEKRSDNTSGGCSGSTTNQSFPPPAANPSTTGAAAPGGQMCAATAHTMEVSLNLNDTPIGYAPQKGPPVFSGVTYIQREADQPAVFTYFNVSPKWTLNWTSFVEDNLTTGVGTNVTRYVNGGGFFGYSGYSGVTGSFAKEIQTGATLTRTPAIGTLVNYTLTTVDGGQFVYAQPDGAASGVRRVFLTQIIDAQGNALTLNYAPVNLADAGLDAAAVPACPGGACLQLANVTDAVGRVTTFTYGFANAPLLITAITDPFGRSAAFTYDAKGRLTSSTDPSGIMSAYGYDDSTGGDPSFVTTLTTPYGTNTFNEFFSGATACTGTTRCLEMTDPLGATERVEYRDAAPGIVFSDTAVPAAPGFGDWNEYLNYRSTYFWDKYVWPTSGTGSTKDYTKAVHYHFMHTPDETQTAWGIESIQRPLESRVWFMHAGQVATGLSTVPAVEATLDAVTAQARLLDDGSTQISTATVNTLGLPTQTVDPLGRTTSYGYAANNLDVLTVQQKTSATAFSTLAVSTYNNQHEPLTYTDAAGQLWQYGYNPAGQLTSVTDPLNEITTYNYDPDGRLSTVVNANNATALTLNYAPDCDTANPNHLNCDLPASVTDSEGRTVGYTRDALDRVTLVTYPDGTSDVSGYTNLDLTSRTDRLGRVTGYLYDAVRRLTQTTDPLNFTVKQGYFANGALNTLTDQNGNVTTWLIDIESRPTSKTYADKTSIAYGYEATTSRLKTVTDALGQVKTLAYDHADEVTGISYSLGADGGALASTPNVAFTHDPFFPRRTGMTDGNGATAWTYVPVGAPGALEVQTEDGPFTNDTETYGYDQLGRTNSLTVGPTAPETWGFDAIGRPTSHVTGLGGFTYGYLGQTSQPVSRALSGTAISTNWSYDTNANDRRLTGITNSSGARSFTFSYATGGNPGPAQNPYDITEISQTAGNGIPAQTLDYAYDLDDRLLTVTQPCPVTSNDAGSPGSGSSSGGGTVETGSDSGPDATCGGKVDGDGDHDNDRQCVFPPSGRFCQNVRPYGAPSLCCDRATDGIGAENNRRQDPDHKFCLFPPEGKSCRDIRSCDAPFFCCERSTDAGLVSDASGASDSSVVDSAASDAASCTPQVLYTYAYDGPGNSTTFTGLNGTTNPTNNNLNQEVTNGMQLISYDADGNTSSDGTRTYTWDAEHRVSSITDASGNITTFVYDGLGRRAQVTFTPTGGTPTVQRFAWCGVRLCEQRDGSDNVTRRYFPEGHNNPATADQWVTTSDQLGSVRDALSAVTGSVLASLDYAPYGQVVRSAGRNVPDFGYGGLFADQNTGLSLALHRVYTPQEGRWLNRDPIAELGGQNLYAYVASNPINYYDPFGLFWDTIFGGTGGAIGRIVGGTIALGGDIDTLGANIPANTIEVQLGGLIGREIGAELGALLDWILGDQSCPPGNISSTDQAGENPTDPSQVAQEDKPPFVSPGVPIPPLGPGVTGGSEADMPVSPSPGGSKPSGWGGTRGRGKSLY